ncbi:hypothetical protein PG984_003602 [Apiospora sp. TS-2023a]
MNDARDFAKGLPKQITAWREATKNLQSAVLSEEAGVNIAAVDVGRDNPSKNPPNYLLDVDVAKKIVDFYEREVDRSVSFIRGCLAYCAREDSDEDSDED